MEEKTDPLTALVAQPQGVSGSRTLQLSGSFRAIVGQTLLILALLMCAGELAARSATFQAPLTAPKLGSRHYQLGHKLALLDATVKQSGPIDCIFIGSSVADLGFDPDSFRNSYREVSGRDIHCFNFGIDASTAASTAALARILVEDYRPRLLIFGMDPRDIAVASEEPDPQAVLDTPWIKYRMGAFSRRVADRAFISLPLSPPSESPVPSEARRHASVLYKSEE